MVKKYHTIIIGGGCLGVACALSLSRSLKLKPSEIAIVDKKVVGAGLSSKHSAIIRAATPCRSSVHLAKHSIELWKNLQQVWGVGIDFKKTGALWIVDRLQQDSQNWQSIQAAMDAEQLDFKAVSAELVGKLCQNAVSVRPEESYFLESDVLQFEPSDLLATIRMALQKSQIDLYEHCQLIEFKSSSHQNLSSIETNQGTFYADHFVNASGPWSRELFAPLGIHIPIALEPVYVANFLVSAQDLPPDLPMIADYCQDIYFRNWQTCYLHMHQPRKTASVDIANSFTQSKLANKGADVIFDPQRFNFEIDPITAYLTRIHNRFPKIQEPLFAGGYQSFFDITPDLQFILGEDPQYGNLFHCLGGGQGLKYAPVMGEMIANQIGGRQFDRFGIDAHEYSLSRFFSSI